MKKLPGILFFLLYTCFVFAQNEKIEALKKKLKTSVHDSSKVINLYSLSQECRLAGDYYSALSYAKQALQLAQEIGFKRGAANAYNNIANVHYNRGNFPEALTNHGNSLKIKQETGNVIGLAASYNNIGAVHDKLGNYADALSNYQNAFKIYQSLGDSVNKAITQNNIAVIYEKEGRYAEALQCHEASLRIFQQLEEKENEHLNNSYLNIGNLFFRQGNYKAAMENYNTFLKKKQAVDDKGEMANAYNNIGVIHERQDELKSAMRSYENALEIMIKLGNKQGVADAYNNIGVVCEKQKDHAAAMKNHFAALERQKELGNKKGIALSYLNIGISQTEMNKLKDAERSFDKCLGISLEIGSRNLTKSCYRWMTILNNKLAASPTTALKRREKYSSKAVGYYNLYTIYSDSLNISQKN